ncbi:probable very-long-chain enoyl-CoA reductase art-1 isoform X2 [Toxorhynchites rutilus septentrionalis]|uniref:probable very-long-chain enoyl-CoA reductase art-1 isoform X2 n=1 Tax=Toxorhynchites rutilus septentrionalis TaxID=329112 RepID=UPI00247AF4D3|nr:probable very-long-chain enoyl-CoA reductase art-1 isoform X2 [Toxorhynchites rutilus septentrionalis]
MQVEILDAKNSKSLGKCRVESGTTIKALKNEVQKLKKSLNIDRQALRLEPRGKTLKDSDTLQSLSISGGKLYVKDLGPQISWKGVFLAEYAGPILVYMLFYLRPSLIYGNVVPKAMSLTANIAAVCWTSHYAKRLLETLFVHRFSHATMPLRNLFKNCSYYWAFAGYVAYHVNHPLFTEPSAVVLYAGLAGFIVSELGNFSIHILLRNLRPAGSTVRKIPIPDSNPLTQLFNFVSCPNYTYEFLSWLSFSAMTSCIPALIFAAAGMYQMTVWAIGKHRNYKKEFKDYPKCRKAIVPFVI